MPDYRSSQQSNEEIGRLYGVGVGPGDPELLTLKAYRVLSRVPVIFVPKKTEQSDSIAASIIGALAPGMETKTVGLVLPMLRDKEQLAGYWHQAAESIWQHLNKGEDCAFVNVGDPLLYGTFIHVLETIKDNHPEVDVEVIPGISSINAAAARAALPLASNDERIAIISGNCEEAVVIEALESFDTIVFIKMNTMFDRLCAILKEQELLDKAVYISRCTTQEEAIVRDISSLKGKKAGYFSLLIVRK